ncbi:hypothetical protein CLV49_1898 [Labedella gwakjiensis]|uniref:Uncharacterized protein n=1 Tax=Labedella gwakjiensis TaxID=390269 RepID=A0A2P8GWD3_9MICO|nr:hypothetical protein [Labedella gwakjiensis]PSL38281.1 hypothetical protein CLV49_1898 [Labedella gwakjiensis]RUQ87181.1 hypothetical protein ELQ93_09730 [Labedella gwakjiensis]
MNRLRPLAVGIVVAALVLGGIAIVLLDARARVAVAYEQADRVAATQSVAADYTRNFWSQPHIVRDAVTESLMYDAMPVFVITGSEASVSVGYGAFRTGNVFPTPLVPWSPRMVTAPLAMGGALAITVTLVAASRWSPRRPRIAVTRGRAGSRGSRPGRRT